jgi:hypothetical protein
MFLVFKSTTSSISDGADIKAINDHAHRHLRTWSGAIANNTPLSARFVNRF